MLIKKVILYYRHYVTDVTNKKIDYFYLQSIVYTVTFDQESLMQI